ncbi:hypothetical protein [Enhygromyxa salina]|nr:hypothetical protein [Enhygromyxa salina]
MDTDDGGEEPPAEARGPDFDVRYQTKYVDIAPGFSQPVCRGSLDEIDRHVEVVADLLGISVEQRVLMFWYNQNATGAMAENSELCDWCSSGCGGCASTDATHVRNRSLHHELVHAVALPTWGRSDTLFEEGLAMGLDRVIGEYEGINSIYNLDLLGTTKPSDVAGSGQHGGAHFSRWLIDRFGPDDLRQMFERLTGSSTKAEVFAAVEEVYGLPFEELEAEYYATAPLAYPLPGLCEGLVHVPWEDGRWEFEASSDCDQPHMFGPADDGRNYAVATVDILPEHVGESLAVWVPSDVSALAWPCLDQPIYDVDPAVLGRSLFDNSILPPVFTMAMRYRVEVPIDDSEDVHLRLCPSNGLDPSHHPIDRTVDPENCLGD